MTEKEGQPSSYRRLLTAIDDVSLLHTAIGWAISCAGDAALWFKDAPLWAIAIPASFSVAFSFVILVKTVRPFLPKSKTARIGPEPVRMDCTICDGTGKYLRMGREPCKLCGGYKSIYTYRTGQPPCLSCDGTGHDPLPGKPCKLCGGDGLMPLPRGDKRPVREGKQD